MQRFSVFLVALLLVSAAVPLALAQDDGEEFEREVETETREIEVKVEGDSVEIESKTKNVSTGEENAFEVEFDADEGAEIKVKFKRGREINETEEEVELSYEVEVEELIEFSDANDNGVWDEGESISRYSVEDATFRPVDYTVQETTNGVTEHVLTAATEDGRFDITLHAVGAFADIEGTQVRPTDVKIDLGIHNYTFQEEGTDLALLAKLTTEREIEREVNDDEVLEQEEGVSIAAGDVRGIFTWKPTATVDGETRQVQAAMRPRPEAGEQSIVLAYPRGSSIVHDPRVGFRLGEPGGASGIALAAVIAAVLIVGAGMLWMRRQ